MVLSEKCIMCKINKRCVLEDGERDHTLCFKCGYKSLSTVGSSSCDDEQRSFEEDAWEKRTKDKKRILF